jgi:hypothetical protein
MIQFLSTICQQDSKGIGGANGNVPDSNAVGKCKNLMMTSRQKYHEYLD